MNNLKTIFSKAVLPFAVVAILGLFSFATNTFATTTNCQPVYGGGQNCQTINVTITKFVLNPQTNQFVNNLGVNDPRYNPGQIVSFQISVTNTGNSQESNVVVTDTFPQFVNFSAGPGSFNQSNNTLSFNVTGLNPGETRTFTLQGVVAAQGGLPQNQGVVCVTNQASETTAEGESMQSNSSFCIQIPQTPTTTTTTVVPQTTVTQTTIPTTSIPTTTKGGLTIFPAPTVTSTPPTGPEALPLLAMIPTGITGWFLRKKSK